jgi:exodeoxyribonuclease-3
MRIATWNVNSLKARMERVLGWLDRAAPDVLLLQETKLADKDAPHDAFAARGYALAHHGEGRWNGVAIASRTPISDVVTNFGDPLRHAKTDETGDDEPLAETRMIAATVSGVRVVSIYAPNGRAVGSEFYQLKLEWYARLDKWLGSQDLKGAFVMGGDFNVAPTDDDVWDAKEAHGGTHVTPRERKAVDTLKKRGLVDAYRLKHDEPGRFTWWDYRGGDFHRNVGMRIDLLLVSQAAAKRVVASEIDREARKGKPTPSDHAPVIVDLDAPGRAFDAGWAGADARIAARIAKSS